MIITLRLIHEYDEKVLVYVRGRTTQIYNNFPVPACIRRQVPWSRRSGKSLMELERKNELQSSHNHCSSIFHSLNIVDRRGWLWSPANIKVANKDAKIYVGRSATLHNLLFCPHTLCMNYVTSSKQLRPRPHVYGYFRIRNFFLADTATVHTYTADSTANP